MPILFAFREDRAYNVNYTFFTGSFRFLPALAFLFAMECMDHSLEIDVLLARYLCKKEDMKEGNESVEEK